MKKLSLYFLQGLIVLLPILGTFYILAFVYTKIAGLGGTILAQLFGRDIPVIDFIFVIVAITLLGMIANWWVSKKILGLVEKLISQVPGVRNIYSTIRDTVKSLAGDKKKFDTVVLVYLSETVARLGFLTIKDAPFKTNNGVEMVGVYFPQTLQVAGDMYWVSKDLVQVIDMSVDQALKLIISGGATGLPERDQ